MIVYLYCEVSLSCWGFPSSAPNHPPDFSIISLSLSLALKQHTPLETFLLSVWPLAPRYTVFGRIIITIIFSFVFLPFFMGMAAGRGQPNGVQYSRYLGEYQKAFKA